MTAGAWVLVVAVLGALTFGLYRAATNGRFTGTHALPLVEEGALAPVSKPSEPRSNPNPSVVERPSVVELAETHGLAIAPGERATLLQFSSAFCAPCRATRRTLSEVAAVVPGVKHVEVDAEHHLEVVRALGILRTPTTLVLDGRGVEVSRAAGAPRKDQVLAALTKPANS
ncbi:thioredoxin family protein [Nocardioides sp. LS1]|uniref:thioredoxin family protein n=1 Tax=Nocardioides sp. LS1 TaxID=1027620 RepID=UPI000F61B048|nr:thioredoxin family protein [Nocardioides sp. LS1]GCD90642.1 hypothetical protein NLS1_26480 [Nocardioides sp. LS1]